MGTSTSHRCSQENVRPEEREEREEKEEKEVEKEVEMEMEEKEVEAEEPLFRYQRNNIGDKHPRLLPCNADH